MADSFRRTPMQMAQHPDPTGVGAEMLAALKELDEAYRDDDPARWQRALERRRAAIAQAEKAGITSTQEELPR